jgi:hypothetical protein
MFFDNLGKGERNVLSSGWHQEEGTETLQ